MKHTTKYKSPAIEIIQMSIHNHLLNWSAPKDDDGPNIPEGKEDNFEFDEDFMDFGNKGHNLNTNK